MSFRILNEGNWDASSDPAAFSGALKFFRRRTVISKSEAEKLGSDAAYQAFWVGGGLQLEQVGKVFDEIDRAIVAGESFQDFKARVADIFSSEAHAETVFRNATQQSYTSGRFHQMTDPKVLEARPYWMHDSVLDSGTTHQCRTLDGKVFPANHEHWRTHYPPGHHRCRRSVRSLTKRAAERRGIETETPDGVVVPEGWGRLPPARKTWKPKGKTKDRKKLTDELKKKKAEQDREKPRKPKRKPKPPAPAPAPEEPKKPAEPPSKHPLVAKAKEFERAVIDNDWGKARSLVREQIAFSRPGTVSKDVAYGRPGASSLTAGHDREDAAGLHYWDGRISLSERAHGDVVAAARNLAAGTYDDPDTYALVGDLARWTKFGGSRKDPLTQLAIGFRVMVHEEIHGTSRISAHIYRGPVAVLEEVGVELNARLVLRSMNKRYDAYVEANPGSFESYDDYIDAVDNVLKDAAPSLSSDKPRLRHFADAFQKGVMSEGQTIYNPDEYIDAIVENLPATPEDRARVRQRLSELEATH